MTDGFQGDIAIDDIQFVNCAIGKTKRIVAFIANI